MYTDSVMITKKQQVNQFNNPNFSQLSSHAVLALPAFRLSFTNRAFMYQNTIDRVVYTHTT